MAENIGSVEDLETPRTSGRQRKVLDYNALAKGLDSANPGTSAPIKSNLVQKSPSNTPSPAKPNQTKSALGQDLFGLSVAELDPSVLPKRLDIIKFWMCIHDTVRSSRKMNNDLKNQVRDEIIGSIVPIWESKCLEVLKGRTLERKVERLIEDADYLLLNPRCKKLNKTVSDTTWFDEERKKLKVDMIFDIGIGSSAPPTPSKRKSDQMVISFYYKSQSRDWVYQCWKSCEIVRYLMI
jgi:hypothetical protein